MKRILRSAVFVAVSVIMAGHPLSVFAGTNECPLFGNPSHQVWEPDPSSGQMHMHTRYYYPDAAAANAAPPEKLRNIPVFRTAPSAMFSSTIDIAARNEILAKGIPALSPAAGKTVKSTPNDLNMEFDPKRNLIQKPGVVNAVVFP